jgi:hypothetical protein
VLKKCRKFDKIRGETCPVATFPRGSFRKGAGPVLVPGMGPGLATKNELKEELSF